MGFWEFGKGGVKGSTKGDTKGCKGATARGRKKQIGVRHVYAVYICDCIVCAKND